MLQELRVSQFAIIDSLNIEFQNGLNILSGETGSGKSVLLKSLALLMGEKASADTIRTGCTQATVEGSFYLKHRPDLKKNLEALGIEADDNQLIVRRIISAGDKSKVYLNGVLSPLAQLREIVAPLIEVTGPSAPLIEMTGQHDNRNLMSKAYHLDLLDQYAGHWDKRSQFESQYHNWLEMKNQITDFERKSQDKAQRLDFLKFQFQEFEKLDLQPEDAGLEIEIKKLKNSSKLLQFADICDQLVYQDDDSISARLKTIHKKALEVAQLDPALQEKIVVLDQAQTLIDDAIYAVRSYVNKIDADPEMLEEKESRLSQIRKLQKKHGDDLTALMDVFNQMASEIKALENSDQHLEQLKKQAAILELELRKQATEMHKTRGAHAKKLATNVNQELLDLNMKGVLFDISVTALDHLTSTGMTDVEFLSQTSPKDPKRPLSKAASGGELSRILLSLKKSAGKSAFPRTYLFDEVDTGVSGTTAEKVGRKLKEIAKGQQVICVTHLPQVAAFGDVHFSIQKSTHKDQAVMTVTELKKQDRVEEIARLISGEKITKTSIAHAQELIKECQM
ncbi:DNA repair protein RecN [Bdellovibrio sp. qaytius]|nr:DNA repair protein RecN [Bdellovibrio sp. qaytius]